jgi:hypothetical protein
MLVCGGLAVRWLLKHDQKLSKHEDIITTLEEELKNVHLSCPIPQGAVKELQVEVAALRLEDSTIKGDVKQIFQRLESVDKSLATMSDDIKAILNHFAFKGMDSK